MSKRRRSREAIRKTKRNIGSRFGFLRNTAKRRGLAFDISLEEYKFLITAACFYCGKETLGVESGGGLDRINNTKGYTALNVLPCCGWCNNARGIHWSVDEFKFITKTMLEYRRKRNYA